MMFKNAVILLLATASFSFPTVTKADVLCELSGSVKIYTGTSSCPATYTRVDLSNFVSPGDVNKGKKGKRGPTGDKGLKGAVGAEGPKGSSGSKGPSGLAGESGPKGTVGPVGQQGFKGAKGETGDKGDTGPTGVKGDAGSGPQGPRGDAGRAGPQGIRGDQGVEGPIGPQGKGISLKAISLTTAPCKIETATTTWATVAFATGSNTKVLDFSCSANYFIANYNLDARTEISSTEWGTPLVAPVASFKQGASSFLSGGNIYNGISVNFTKSLKPGSTTLYEKVLYYYSLLCCPISA